MKDIKYHRNKSKNIVSVNLDLLFSGESRLVSFHAANKFLVMNLNM